MASNMKRFFLLSEFSKGSFLDAYLVMDNQTEKKIVIKTWHKENEMVTKEINILRNLQHKNIVKYIDHSDGEKVIEINTKGQGYILSIRYLTTEYCENGDLNLKIKKAKNMNGRFSEDQIIKWVYQATDALAYLHSKKLMHRDIKPANMLLTKEDDIKLSNFGVASYIKENEKQSYESDFVGTLLYMSPEVRYHEKYNVNSDIWSLGCVLYELIYLQHAFESQTNLRASGQFSIILPKMLEKDPKKRISSKDLLTELTKFGPKNYMVIKNDDPWIGTIIYKKYEIISKIGLSLLGEMYRVKDNYTGDEKALDMFRTKEPIENLVYNIMKLNHANIRKYFDHYILEKDGFEYTCLIMEYFPNINLSDKINEAKVKNRKINQDQIIKWIYQMTFALTYLHSRNIRHNYINSSNIFLTKNNDIKLGAFYLTDFFDDDEVFSKKQKLYMMYSSPEIIESKYFRDDVKIYLNSDIWSLGCVLYELIFLRHPFPTGQTSNLQIPDLIDSGQFSNILLRMLQKDSTKRISSTDLLSELTKLNRKNFITKNEDIEQRKKEEEKRDLELERLKEHLNNEKKEWEKKSKLQLEEKLRKEVEKLKMENEMETKKLREQHEIEKSAILKKEELNKDSFKRYEKLKFLKAGGYGEVYLVRDKKINVYKAMKMLEKSDKSAENEFLTYLKVNHENIVKYFDHFDHYEEENSTDYICIITEYCENGDLRRMINKVKRDEANFRDSQILEWITQATHGLKYLHRNRIVHRDIKPENILLTKDNVIKLVDLGVAKYLSKTTIGRTYGGTKQYMSPEQNRGRQYEDDEEYETHNCNTDVWSLGCVLYELITLEFAFPDGQSSNPDIPRLNGLGCFSGVLKKMLVKDPEYRISSKKLYAELILLADENDEF